MTAQRDTEPGRPRRGYRRSEITIEAPKLRKMTPAERAAADAALARLLAAMLADEQFLAAEQQRQGRTPPDSP